MTTDLHSFHHGQADKQQLHRAWFKLVDAAREDGGAANFRLLFSAAPSHMLIAAAHRHGNIVIDGLLYPLQPDSVHVIRPGQRVEYDYDFNREALMRARPDRIVALEELLPDEEKEKLRQIAPVLFLPWGRENWRVHLRLTAQFLQREKEAEKWLARYDEQVAAVRRKMPVPFTQGALLILNISARGMKVWGRRAGTVLYDDLQVDCPESVERIRFTEEIDATWLAGMNAGKKHCYKRKGETTPRTNTGNDPIFRLNAMPGFAKCLRNYCEHEHQYDRGCFPKAGAIKTGGGCCDRRGEDADSQRRVRGEADSRTSETHRRSRSGRYHAVVGRSDGVRL